MKRAYIMLTSIAVLAGVGGALAFKANAIRNGAFCVSSRVNGIHTTCTFTKLGKITASVIPLTYATVFPAGVTKCTLANGGAGVCCTRTSFTTIEP